MQPHFNVLSALFSRSGVASLEDTLCSLCELEVAPILTLCGLVVSFARSLPFLLLKLNFYVLPVRYTVRTHTLLPHSSIEAKGLFCIELLFLVIQAMLLMLHVSYCRKTDCL